MAQSALQFKSYLKHLPARLENAKNMATEGQVKEELQKLIKDLREDLRG